MQQFKRFGKFMLPCFLFAASAAADPVPPNHAYPGSGPFYSGEFAPPSSGAKPETIRVVSYNVNFSPNPGAIIDVLLHIKDVANADVIFLQEVTGPIGGKENAPEIIARALQMNYFFSPGMIHAGVDYGNAILSRFPLSNFRKVILPQSASETITRSAVVADAQIGTDTITFSSVHLSTLFPDSFGAERLRPEQLKGLVETLPDGAGKLVLVGGDLNSFRPVSRRNIYALMDGYSFTNAHPTNAWTMRYLHFHLDHLFQHGGLKPVSYGVGYGAKASDHVPIWSVIAIP